MNMETAAMVSFARELFPELADVAAKSLVLAGAALVTSGLVRRAPASTRHLVYLSALLGLLALPLLAALLPTWRTPVLTLGRPSGVVPTGTSAATDAPRTTNAGDGAPAAPPHVGPTRAGPPASPGAPPSPLAPETAGAADAGGGSRETPWPVLCFALWLAGVALVLARLAAGVAVERDIRRRCEPADTGLLEPARAALGVNRPVALWVGSAGSAAPAVPLTAGFLRPAVLLPSGAADWPTERLRVVLLHEMAHVRRSDWLFFLLAQLACALYWFNPLAWLLQRRMRRESEQACDDLVLAAGVKPSEYAGHLLEIVRSLRDRPARTGAAVAMARRSEIAGRLQEILAPERKRGALLSRRALLLAATLAGLLLVPLAMLRPAASFPPLITFVRAEVVALPPGAQNDTRVNIVVRYNAASLYRRLIAGPRWKPFEGGYLRDASGKRYAFFPVPGGGGSQYGTTVGWATPRGRGRYAVGYAFPLARIPAAAGRVTFHTRLVAEDGRALPVAIIVRDAADPSRVGKRVPETDTKQPHRNASGAAYSATLANGVRVEVLGIGRAAGGWWWRPDGTPAAVPAPPSRFAIRNVKGDEKTRYVAVKTIYTADAGPSGTWQFQPESRLYGTLFTTPRRSRTGNTVTEIDYIPAKLPKEARTCALRYATAAGAWETAAVSGVVPGRTVKRTREAGKVIFTLATDPSRDPGWRTKGRSQNAILMVSDTLGEDRERRLVAVDAGGKTTMLLGGYLLPAVIKPGLGGDRLWNEATAIVPTVLLKRARGFRLETRRYQWAEFPGLALEPRGPRAPSRP